MDKSLDALGAIVKNLTAVSERHATDISDLQYNRNVINHMFVNHLAEFVLAMCFLIGAAGLSVGLVAYSMRSSNHLCSMTVANAGGAHTGETSVVIVRPDGKSETLPLGTCATLVDRPIP